MKRELGKNLIALRERRMLTQAELALAAGVSPTTVSGIECGKIPRPRFGTLRKLSRALEVRPEELFSGSRDVGGSASLSVDWVMTARDEDFEASTESSDAATLAGLMRGLETEKSRLRTLYGEAQSPAERQSLKGRIRHAAACIASIEATIEGYGKAI